MRTHNLDQEKRLLLSAQKELKNFDELYKYFINDVYRFSFSIVNNSHDAEDITSRVFIELYKKLTDFVWQDISLKRWLFRCARNFSYEKFREPIHEELDELYHTPEEYEISFVDEIINKETINYVKTEIQKLNPLEQETITLRIWEGMQFNEIASLQDQSIDAVKKRFYRSIEKIKKVMKDKRYIALLSLPSLLTTIFLVGATPSYAAPHALSAGSDFTNLIITKQTTMTNIIHIIKSKTFVTAIAGITLLSVAATAVLIIHRNKPQNSKDQEQISHVIPTIQPIPTINITETPTVLPIPIGIATYTDTDVKLTFDYPTNYSVTADIFYPEVQSTGQFASRSITIKSEKGTPLYVEFRTGPAGCIQSPSYDYVNIVFKNTASDMNIARVYETDEFGTITGISYGEYSSAIQNQGYFCGVITLTNKLYSEFHNTSGHFFLSIPSTTISSDDLVVFDGIVKSMKRL